LRFYVHWGTTLIGIKKKKIKDRKIGAKTGGGLNE